MARLEDLTIGARVTGIVGDAPVTVVAVNWFGDMGLEVTVKDDRGQLSPDRSSIGRMRRGLR